MSGSVADALDFLDQELHLDEFAGVGPTSAFIRKVNGLFDLLNSRHPFGKGYKTALRKENENYWKPFALTTINYLSRCTHLNGTLLYQTKNKTPFIGFIVSAVSALNIYEESVKETQTLKYLLTYKFSQDHLELFFL